MPFWKLDSSLVKLLKAAPLLDTASAQFTDEIPLLPYARLSHLTMQETCIKHFYNPLPKCMSLQTSEYDAKPFVLPSLTKFSLSSRFSSSAQGAMPHHISVPNLRQFRLTYRDHDSQGSRFPLSTNGRALVTDQSSSHVQAL
ncbi:hypothetical protein L218DRAFT_1009184 [Marasmius fiardii PR-910]|nr:hypothetical protein L218DRAFT_1009379 [Marasmius fiardii PR-910]KAF9254879.1 hypothetical protein L218DRAFT_1009176 [Marasmius fiardii PR-910]KAF9254884.1 hypothetical protein L218DRAFT_1009184 [Marasmius fiardii PR-910]